MFRWIIVRFALPIALAALVVAYFGLPYIDRLLTEWFRTDVELRAQLLVNSMQDTLPELVERGDRAKLRIYLNQTVANERLMAVLVCKLDGSVIYKTEQTPATINCDRNSASEGSSEIVQLPSGSVQISNFDVSREDVTPFRVRVVHDLSFVDRRQSKVRDFVLAFLGVSAIVLALLVVFAAWFLLRHWAKVLVGDIRGRRFLDDALSPGASMPILSQVRQVLREIEETQRLEIDYHENWTPQALQQVVHDQLRSPTMIIVSNREPYVHVRGENGRPHVQLPASGMVTALEPVMRACSGVWVAHGSGNADRQVVDMFDRVRVPPGDPSYTLRRVWLTQQEEEGYYYGFSNEGLWALCHLAYVRPAFREADWEAYQAVNLKFAEAVVRECHGAKAKPLVLIQDYHFAVLPRLLRDRLKGATIALFWHIPWPNAETFGVCPWKQEVLLHMLGADILGFHTRYHCQNFLATVDRFVECQIDHEHMTVTLQGHVCHVAPYPISIEWPPRWLAQLPAVEISREAVRKRYGIGADVSLGLGVERWDFTKGIIERFSAIEALLNKYPKLRGCVSLLQIAAPSRSKLPAYQALQQQTHSEAIRINEQFGTETWKPIVLIEEHREPVEVFELYRAADFCLVNSLHDGMNLVAKEFVAARDDEDGVLVLSTFAGASRELLEALLVNPFDVSETADAIHTAINMPRDERRERMQLMRRTVKENNVYRWAGRMLMDAARIRQRQSLSNRDSYAQRQTGMR
jgi:trehalose 6-phosphate synthase/phosphatase